jgi:hypothetical protein
MIHLFQYFSAAANVQPHFDLLWTNILRFKFHISNIRNVIFIYKYVQLSNMLSYVLFKINLLLCLLICSLVFNFTCKKFNSGSAKKFRFQRGSVTKIYWKTLA